MPEKSNSCKLSFANRDRIRRSLFCFALRFHKSKVAIDVQMLELRSGLKYFFILFRGALIELLKIWRSVCFAFCQLFLHSRFKPGLRFFDRQWRKIQSKTLLNANVLNELLIGSHLKFLQDHEVVSHQFFYKSL